MKLAAIQYQVYIQHRTAMNSTVAFCKWVWSWSEFTPVLPCHSSYGDTLHTHTHTHTHPPLFAQNRPSDFFPVEYAGLRGIDQKMFKELETMNLKAEKDIYQTYKNCYLSLPTHDTVFFPARVGGGGGGWRRAMTQLW